MIYGIPSYRRAERQKTLDCLESLGIRQEQIWLSVQDEQDYEEYRAAGVDKRVGRFIYVPGKCAADNRNTLLSNVKMGGWICLLEDDIKWFGKAVNHKYVKITSAQQLEAIAAEMVARCDLRGTVLAGMSQNSNPYFTSSKIKERALFDGSWMLVKQCGLRFDNSIPMFDDSEYCLKVMRRYGRLQMYDYYHAEHDRRVPGGCMDLWEDQSNQELSLAELYRRYGDMINVAGPEKESRLTLKPAYVRGKK